MALSALIPILASVGAPILKELISDALGDPVGEVASDVIGMVADGLGVAPTPEAIVEEYQLDPAGVAPVIRAVEDENKAHLVAMLGAINKTMRAEAKAKGLLTRIWRPVFGLLFGLIYFLLGLAMIFVIVRANDPIAIFGVLSGLIVTYLACGSSVLGVYVWQRSSEKIRRVA